MNKVEDNQFMIYFYGQDYSSIDETAQNIRIYDSSGSVCYIDVENKCFSFDKKEDDITVADNIAKQILTTFLQDEKITDNKGNINNKSFVVNKAEDTSKRFYKDYKLYNSDRSIFDGLVGIVRKKIVIDRKRLFQIGEDEETFYYSFDVILQISTRYDNCEEDNLNGKHFVTKPFFLSTLLLANKLKLNNNTVPHNDEQLLDYLMVFYFKTILSDACQKGYYRKYVVFEKNDDRLRGSIDVARHIRLNMGLDNGKIAYRSKENTINNNLNRLIITTYDYLKSKYYSLVADNIDSDYSVYPYIQFLKREIGFVNENVSAMISDNIRPISHPLYHEYEELRKLCIKILRGESASFFDGNSKNDVQGILFYLPDLWEKYLETSVLSKACNLSAYNLSVQPPIETFGTKVTEESTSYTYTQETYPDFAFEVEKKYFLILDAKFKPHWDKVAFSVLYGKQSSIGNYYLEDYDKCIRDMVDLGAHSTGIIFPSHRTELDLRVIEHSVSNNNLMLKFFLLPVAVPFVDVDSNYEEWNTEFEENVNRFLHDENNGFCGILDKCFKRECVIRKYDEKIGLELSKID